ncbi:MAG TPA: Na+/H+ antiporter NhaA [Chitinophagales bacterium]|nr:Na+/H+ antiporter NhaA [Chitinophagales bacterium]
MKKSLMNPIAEMAQKGQLTGILLILSTIISLAISNSVLQQQYLHFWHLELGPSFFQKSLDHWINDGLMVIFFFMVGLEIRREVVRGELSDLRQSLLPVMAAIGGMAVPALFFVAFNLQGDFLQGWAVPTATDIAFSLGVLSLMGNKVPFALKIFLTALAIIDDLGAVLVIAIFYTGEILPDQLLYAGATIVLLVALNRFKVRPLVFYILPGIVLWWFILHSGVHATIAGVLLAFCIPMNAVENTEHALQKPVNFLILPLFALANTAIPFPAAGISVLVQPLSLGIIAGLLLGKPLGILSVAWLSVKAGWTQLPSSVSWRKLLAAGFTAGIGFTMSIFIANLAFSDIIVLDGAKLAILVGSLAAGLVGVFLLIGDKERVAGE